MAIRVSSSWGPAATCLKPRGDKVIATARNVESLAGLKSTYGEAVLTLGLDVTDKQASIDAVAAGVAKFGRIDVAVSNAGYGHFGFVEELTETEVRDQLETNVLGSLWVIQAVLPVMRRQKSGHIIQLSSIGGVVAFPSLGIKLTLVEPAGHSTDWGGTSAKHSVPNPAYQPARDAMKARGSSLPMGNPQATAEALLALVDSPQPPLRLFLGAITLPMVEKIYQSKLDTWKAWWPVSAKAQG